MILEFSGKYFITLEGDFTLHAPGKTFQLSPDNDPEEKFEPLRELVGVDVTECAADDAGTLTITFSNEAVIHSDPDGMYEAWNLAGPRGMKVVSMPSGGLATWSPDPDA